MMAPPGNTGPGGMTPGTTGTIQEEIVEDRAPAFVATVFGVDTIKLNEPAGRKRKSDAASKTD